VAQPYRYARVYDRALYVSDNWDFARGSLSEQSRAKAAKALRAVAFVAQTMAESLAEGEGEDDPRTNYGLQR
jgi:hypothetical protein